MADEVKGTGATTAPAGDAAPAKEQQPTTYAGKLQGEEGLYKGLSEIRKAHGMPDKAPDVLAKMYADPKEAEAEYLALQTALSKRAKDVGKTGTLLDQTLPAETAQPDKVEAEPIPATQVVHRAGMTVEAVYSEYIKSNRTLSDETAEKLRTHDPVASQMPKKAGLEYIRYNADKHFSGVADATTKAATLAGSEDALRVMISERHKYVPADERGEIDELLNGTPNQFVAGVRRLKQHQEASKPAPQKGTVTGDRGAARPSANRRNEVVMALAKDPTNPALLAELRKLSQR